MLNEFCQFLCKAPFSQVIYEDSSDELDYRFFEELEVL